MRYKNAIVRRARIEDAFKLAANLRTEDLIEIRSFHPERPPYKSLIDGIVLSGDNCWTIEGNDLSIIGIFGVVKAYDNVGSVWLLGSGGIKKIQREFIRHSKFWVDQLHKDYDVISNFVYAENHIHINWLKWLGFTFIRRIEKFGHFGLPFYEFLKIKN